ncbi:hypothetical protein Phab24_id156 [Acinetobacter phage Phab24]|nr:hypothetical protein Phab24_id156 [Acinetobacter phage Phab24]
MTNYYYQDELYIIEKDTIWDEDWYFLYEYTVENCEVKKGHTIKASTNHSDIVEAMNVHKMYLRGKGKEKEMNK